jgi:tRNA(His) guanylyltransferase
MKDTLGDRIKDFYENRTRYSLCRRSYTIIRIDGKAFHTYTKGLNRPFDEGLIADMDETAAYLCKNIQGAKLAYVQSDEISILLTDFDDLKTDAWYDGNIQKITSVAASLATARFNQLRMKRAAEFLDGVLDCDDIEKFKVAMFDARVFQIPFWDEVENYFIWRQQDATRNSISSVAQSLYSHKELEGKSSEDKQEMIFQKGINWNDYTYRQKRGGIVGKVNETWKRKKDSREKGSLISPQDVDNAKQAVAILNSSTTPSLYDIYERSVWKNIETPIFLQERDFLNIIGFKGKK